MVTFSRQWPRRSLMFVLSQADREDLLLSGTVLQFASNEILMLQGARSDCVFAILDGFVKITGMWNDGDEALLAIRVKGELVGEFGLLDGRPRSATVTAASSVVVVRLGENAFFDYLYGHPDASMEIMRSVVRKMRVATRRRLEMRGRNARARLASVLWELAEEHGEETSQGRLIDLALTQVELGSLAHVAASTVEKILGQFDAERLIEPGYRRITVRDMAALRLIGG